MKKSFKISGSREYLVEFDGPDIFINGQKWEGSVSGQEDSSFLIRSRNKNHSTEIINASDKTYEVKIGHQYYNLELKDDLDLLIEKMGFGSANKQKDEQVKAPMPGLIKEVLVNPGDHVEPGQTLIILEAMKMENAIKASHQGQIIEISVQPGQNVEKNQILVKY